MSGYDGIGLRGTTFVSIDNNNKIDYVREVVEPLFKPGAAIIPLLKVTICLMIFLNIYISIDIDVL